MAVIEKHDINDWCRTFLAALDRASSPNLPVSWHQPESIRSALEKLRDSMRRPKSKRAAETASPSSDPGVGMETAQSGPPIDSTTPKSRRP